MYQHDVSESRLSRSLDGVVSRVVNEVGVNLNTASLSLLRHVSGLGERLADRLVEERDRAGPFKSRDELIKERKVPGLGPKAYQQAAGFLRVVGRNPLDNTGIHPESYELARLLLASLGLRVHSPLAEIQARLAQADRPFEAQKLGASLATVDSLIEQLMRPGRDVREDLPPPLLRDSMLTYDDIVVGARLQATAMNFTDFGTFLDVGVGTFGLLPNVRLKIGQVLPVFLVNKKDGKLKFSLKPPFTTHQTTTSEPN